jgi:5'-phosphate synthase pdxT subunit
VDVGILALQGDVAEHRAALTAVGVASRPVRRRTDLIGLDGIVLPGGESTTMSMLLTSSGLEDALAKELDAGLPALGTCAGMILLAKTVSDGRADQRSYGAIDIAVRRNGYGRQLDSFECDLDVPLLGTPPLHAVFIRAPVVESTAPGVEVLAHEDGRPVLCRQGAVLVAAFHPELTVDRRVHELFVSMVHQDRSERHAAPRQATGTEGQGR